MTKKIVSAALLAVALLVAVRYLRHRAAPSPIWTTYDGRLAKLDIPKEWKLEDGEDKKVKFLNLSTETVSGEFLLFTLTDYLPDSGTIDINRFVKDLVDGSPEPHPIVVKNTTFNGGAAQEFSTYMPKPFWHERGANGADVLRTSFTESRHIVFVRKNGRIFEIAYDLPETNPDDYEPIFRHIIGSLELHD